VLERLIQLEHDDKQMSLAKVAKYLEKVCLMLERLKAHNLPLDTKISELISRLIAVESNAVLIQQQEQVLPVWLKTGYLYFSFP